MCHNFCYFNFYLLILEEMLFFYLFSMLGVIILPFIAILFDLVAAAAYFSNYNHQSSEVLFVGMIFQGVITLFLLVMIISYKGKKYARVQTESIC